VSPHLSLPAEILTWAGVSGALLLLAVWIGISVRNDRRHDARIARYEAARAANAEHWARVKEAFPGMARDLSEVPPSCDPLVTENPRSPQQEERRDS
jgi:hypothetical protein